MRVATIAFLVTCICVSVADGAVEYILRGLGDLPGGEYRSEARAINDLGQTTGYSSLGGGGLPQEDHAFLWDAAGGMRDLGKLSAGQQYGVGSGISNLGHVAGTAHVSSAWHAYLWDPVNGMRDIGALSGYDGSTAWDINDSDWVVGYCVAPSNSTAFLWDPLNGMRNLGDLAGGADSSVASAVNNAGRVCGRGTTAIGQRAFIWDAAGGMRELSGFPGKGSWAEGMSNAGHVVGAYEASYQHPHACLWDPISGAIDLGRIPGGGESSLALDVNDMGVVVGRGSAASGETRAFVWDRVNGMRDLNALIGPGSGWDLHQAYGISNTGQIVGYGHNPAGNIEGFILTPIPEPGMVALVGLALIGTLLAGRKKRS